MRCYKLGLRLDTFHNRTTKALVTSPQCKGQSAESTCCAQSLTADLQKVTRDHKEMRCYKLGLGLDTFRMVALTKHFAKLEAHVLQAAYARSAPPVTAAAAVLSPYCCRRTVAVLPLDCCILLQRRYGGDARVVVRAAEPVVRAAEPVVRGSHHSLHGASPASQCICPHRRSHLAMLCVGLASGCCSWTTMARSLQVEVALAREDPLRRSWQYCMACVRIRPTRCSSSAGVGVRSCAPGSLTS